MNGFNALRQGILSFTGSLQGIHDEREQVRLDAAKMKIERGITEARNQFELERIETERLRGLGEITPEEANQRFEKNLKSFRSSFQDSVPNEIFDKKVSDALMHEANSMVTNFENEQKKMFHAKDADRQIMEFNELKRIRIQEDKLIASDTLESSVNNINQEIDAAYSPWMAGEGQEPDQSVFISDLEAAYDDAHSDLLLEINEERRPQIREANLAEENAKKEAWLTAQSQRLDAVARNAKGVRIELLTDRQYESAVHDFAMSNGTDWDILERNIEGINQNIIGLVSPVTGKNLNVKVLSPEEVLLKHFETLGVEEKINILKTKSGLESLNNARASLNKQPMRFTEITNFLVGHTDRIYNERYRIYSSDRDWEDNAVNVDNQAKRLRLQLEEFILSHTDSLSPDLLKALQIKSNKVNENLKDIAPQNRRSFEDFAEGHF